MGAAGRILAAGGLFGTGALTVEGLASSLTQAATSGVRFNSTLEQTALGIAALFRTFAPQQFTSLDSALAASAGTLSDLKVAARLTTASFEELATAYQAIAGPAFSAGIPIDKQIRLTTMLAQAVTALGLPSWQIPQEGRSILSGTIGPDSTVARSLGITNAEVARAKMQGDLFGYLEKRLASFAEAGDRAGRTLTGAASNLKDTFAQLSGEAFKPVNDALTKALLEITNQLDDPVLKNAMREFGDSVAALAEKLPEVVAVLPALVDSIGDLLKITALYYGGQAALGVASAGMGALAAAKAWPGAKNLASLGMPAAAAATLGGKLPAWMLQGVGRTAGGLAPGAGALTGSVTVGGAASFLALAPFVGAAAYGAGNLIENFFGDKLRARLALGFGAINAEEYTALTKRGEEDFSQPQFNPDRFTPRSGYAQPMAQDDLKEFYYLRRDQLEFLFRNKLVSFEDYMSQRRGQLETEFKQLGDEKGYARGKQNLEQFAFEQRRARRKEMLDGMFDNLKAPTFAGAQRGMFQSQGSFAAWMGSVNYQKAAVDVLNRIERLLMGNNQLLRDGGTV